MDDVWGSVHGQSGLGSILLITMVKYNQQTNLRDRAWAFKCPEDFKMVNICVVNDDIIGASGNHRFQNSNILIFEVVKIENFCRSEFRTFRSVRIWIEAKPKSQYVQSNFDFMISHYVIFEVALGHLCSRQIHNVFHFVHPCISHRAQPGIWWDPVTWWIHVKSSQVLDILSTPSSIALQSNVLI